MKNLHNQLYKVICFSTFPFTFIACGGNSSDPMIVAEQFAEAYCNIDFDKCNKLMFEDAKNRFVPSSERNEVEIQMFKMMQEQSKKMKYEVTLNKEKTEINPEQERANVVFDVSSATESSFKGDFSISLEKDKQTGKWLVNKYSNPF